MKILKNWLLLLMLMMMMMMLLLLLWLPLFCALRIFPFCTTSTITQYELVRLLCACIHQLAMLWFIQISSQRINQSISHLANNQSVKRIQSVRHSLPIGQSVIKVNSSIHSKDSKSFQRSWNICWHKAKAITSSIGESREKWRKRPRQAATRRVIVNRTLELLQRASLTGELLRDCGRRLSNLENFSETGRRLPDWGHFSETALAAL